MLDNTCDSEAINELIILPLLIFSSKSGYKANDENDLSTKLIGEISMLTYTSIQSDVISSVFIMLISKMYDLILLGSNLVCKRHDELGPLGPIN